LIGFGRLSAADLQRIVRMQLAEASSL